MNHTRWGIIPSDNRKKFRFDPGTATNLDGGPSSGLTPADPQQIVPSATVLPIVRLVRVR
jgi:hypothetical protein